MRRAVTGTSKNSDGDITGLCGAWGSVDKWTAIRHINAEAGAYHVNGYDVIVVTDSTVSGGQYLRTTPGGGTSNNLDSLPDC
jgi:hypothetical protein